MSYHFHDSCSPDLARDLEVTGLREQQETKATILKEPAKPQQIVSITALNLEEEVIERSHKVPVFVLIGSPVQQGMTQLSKQLRTLADGAGLRWILGTINADLDPGAASHFRPHQLPCVYAVADGASIAIFEPNQPGLDIADWVDEIVRRVAPQLPGLDPEPEQGSAPAPHDPRLIEAAQAVQAGDFAHAVSLYDELLRATPSDPTLLRARAAVSVLVRAEHIDRSTDPLARAAENPLSVDVALDAADVEVLLDRPVAAVERLAGLIDRGEERLRARLVDLLRLLDPADPAAIQARSRMATALH